MLFRSVDHPNFSPRIIEMMTLSAGQAALTPADFLPEFLRALDDPESLWRHAYERQISERARHLLQVRATLPAYVLLKDLKTAFRAFTGTPLMDLDIAFEVALRELDGSFLRSQLISGTLVVSFANPSISDFLAHRLEGDLSCVDSLLAHSVFFEQVDRIGRFLTASTCDEGTYRAYWRKAEAAFSLADCNLVLLGRQTSPDDVRPVPLTYQSRLAALVWRLKERDSETGRSIVRSLFRALASTLEASPTAEKSSLLDLIRAIAKDLPTFDPEGDFFRATKKVFLHELDNLEEFDYCFNLERITPDALGTDIDLLRARFAAVFEDDAYSYRSEVDDPGSLRSYSEDLQRIGEWLGVDVAYQCNALEERAVEKEGEVDPEPDFDDSGGWSGVAAARDETDDCFDALKYAPADRPAEG